MFNSFVRFAFSFGHVAKVHKKAGVPVFFGAETPA